MKTLENWKKDIEESLIDGYTHFISVCPICGDRQETRVDSSDDIARAAAIGKVIAHIKLAHPDSVD